MVDYILPLPHLKSHKEYDKLIMSIQPAYIAITKNDPVTSYVTRQAKLVTAELKEVTPRISTHASSKIIEELNI
jgi:hypothetical protein